MAFLRNVKIKINNKNIPYLYYRLSQNPDDDDAKEAVEELVRGSIDSDTIDVENVITTFFRQLNIDKGSNLNDDDNNNNQMNDNDDITPLKLTNKIILKDKDIQSFASGLSSEPMIDHEDGTLSSMASFYANMIDISENEAAISERKRRKERQKAIREQMEEEERQRALKEAMDILNIDGDNSDGDNPEDMLNAAKDNSADVHLKNFDLPNLRGGGPDLLQNASLTLAKGRRYGLMGRNGCGKVSKTNGLIYQMSSVQYFH